MIRTKRTGALQLALSSGVFTVKRQYFGLLIPCLLMIALLPGCATTHQISSGGTNQCMNVVNHGYPVAGTPVHVKQCDPWQNQQWAFDKGHIVGVGGFCLDVQGSAAAEGAPILYVPCDGRPSQNWSVSNGAITGIGGMCVDVQGHVPYDQAPLVLATCNGGPTQQWAVH
jgi:beta-galactosidase